MAVIWQNSLDGPNATPITVANSAAYGNAVDEITAPVAYSTGWAAAGSSSALLGNGAGAEGTLWAAFATQPSWSVRFYANISAGSTLSVYSLDSLVYIDAAFGTYELGTTDVSSLAADLVSQPIRIEVARVGTTTTYRVWWTDPHSAGTPDHQHAETGAMGAFDFFALEGGHDSPTWVDEIAVAQGEWIGPAVTPQEEVGAAIGTILLRGEADGYASGLTPAEGHLVLRGEADGWAAQQGGAQGGIVLRGEADGLAGASVATGAPVRDMWLGPLGLLHRMAERADWQRTPELGVETHTSLHGRVTASRALWTPRTTTLAWGRLLPVDAQALQEMALSPARTDPTITLIDPDAAATNLLTVEQSRGRPLIGVGATALEDLYGLDGPGALAAGTVAGVRYAVLTGGASGTDITWLHPYYGDRGWPVMPGWPVYFTVTDVTGGPGAHLNGRLWLTFRDHAGAVISSAAGLVGTGACEADAPAGAATVTPHLRLSSAPGEARLVGLGRLTYAPQDPGPVPLGNGCPVYAVERFTDTPDLPWYTTALTLREVRAYAAR
jgi:hypothetical protein